MKRIRLIKISDLLIQLFAIVLPWLYVVYIRHDKWGLFSDIQMVNNILTVICQGVLCFAGRYYMPKEFRAKSRATYELALLLIIAMVTIATIMKALLLALILLNVICPVMIIWYLAITIAELRKLWHKPIGV